MRYCAARFIPSKVFVNEKDYLAFLDNISNAFISVRVEGRSEYDEVRIMLDSGEWKHGDQSYNVRGISTTIRIAPPSESYSMYGMNAQQQCAKEEEYMKRQYMMDNHRSGYQGVLDSRPVAKPKIQSTDSPRSKKLLLL